MQQILLIQTAFIGDVILATGVLEKLHAHFPEAHIDFLVRKGNESLLHGHPFVRKVLVRDKKLGKWKSLRLLLKDIRTTRYDIVVNLHRFLSSGILAGFSKGKHICGFDKNPLSWRYHHKVPHLISKTPGGPHELDRNQSAIAHFTDTERAFPKLYPSAEAYEKVRRTKPYVCIAPTSVWFTKQWPGDKWAELIGRVPAATDVLLLGAPGDAGACEAIAKAAGRAVEVLAGKLSLLESAALMAGADMNYVNDSAPLHLATAMRAPVTAVFCSTVPAFGFGPGASNGRTVETDAGLACRPCGLHGKRKCPEGHFRCAEIPVERVLAQDQA
ncbi:MAG: glycosyltransferase family 9 protein [Bacteroidota bacterium]